MSNLSSMDAVNALERLCVKTNEDCLRMKRAGSYLNTYTEKFLSDVRCRLYLVTGVLTPDTCTVDESWILIQEKEREAVDALSGRGDVIFILSCIEEHPGAKKQNRKNKSTGQVEVKEVKVTLSGYAHVHFIVGIASATGSFPESSDVNSTIFNIFPDSDTRKKGRRANRDSNSKILGYAVKNSKFMGSTLKLGRFPCTLWNLVGDRRVNNFFFGLQDNGILIFDPESNPIQKIEEISSGVHRSSPSVINAVRLGLRIVEDVERKQDGSKKRSALEWMKFVMERERLACFEGKIYQKVAGSSYSWKFWGEKDRLIGECMDDEHWELIDAARASLLNLLGTTSQRVIRSVEMKYEWIEFRDCVFHLGTGMLIPKGLLEVVSFAYFREVSAEDIILERYWNDKSPGKWLQILINSGLDRDPWVFVRLFRLLVPKKPKDPTLVLVGPPNSGKTTIVEPLAKLYPEDRTICIRSDGGFELSGIGDKEIIILDEYDGYLSDYDIKKITEGSTMSIRGKHTSARDVYISGRPVFISNTVDWMRTNDIHRNIAYSKKTLEDLKLERMNKGMGNVVLTDMDQALSVRLAPYSFREMTSVDPAYRDEIILFETPWIILCLAKVAFGELVITEDISIITDRLERYGRVGYLGI